MNLNETILQLNFSDEQKELFVEAVLKVTVEKDKKHLLEFFKDFEIKEETINIICEKALKNEFGLVEQPMKKCPVCGKEFEYDNDDEVYCSKECEEIYNKENKESVDNKENNNNLEELKMNKSFAIGYLKGLSDFEKGVIKESTLLVEKGDDFTKGYEKAILEKKEEEKKISESLNLYDVIKEIRKLKEDIDSIKLSLEESKKEEPVVEIPVIKEEKFSAMVKGTGSEIYVKKEIEAKDKADALEIFKKMGFEDVKDIEMVNPAVNIETKENEEVEKDGRELFNEKVSDELKQEILENFSKSLKGEINNEDFGKFLESLNDKFEVDEDEKTLILDHLQEQYNKISCEFEENKKEEKNTLIEKHIENLFESDKEKVKELIEKVEYKDLEDLEEQIAIIINEFKKDINKEEETEEKLESEDVKFLKQNNLF